MSTRVRNDRGLYLAYIYLYIAELSGLHGIKSAMDIVVYCDGYCRELCSDHLAMQ